MKIFYLIYVANVNIRGLACPSCNPNQIFRCSCGFCPLRQWIPMVKSSSLEACPVDLISVRSMHALSISIWFPNWFFCLLLVVAYKRDFNLWYFSLLHNMALDFCVNTYKGFGFWCRSLWRWRLGQVSNTYVVQVGGVELLLACRS